MALNRVTYGEPTDPSEPTAYALAYRTNNNGDETIEPVILDLEALNLDWIDEHTSGHTIYATGDESGELEDHIETVNLETETGKIAEKSNLTARELQAYTLTKHYNAPRREAAKIMGIEANTLDTLKQRAEDEIEKARFTVEWA